VNEISINCPSISINGTVGEQSPRNKREREKKKKRKKKRERKREKKKKRKSLIQVPIKDEMVSIPYLFIVTD
jgi:hypothetical protein